jgi:tetratricopeptide (TPR) repeat protein
MSGSWWFLACRGHVDEVERWAQAALAATPEVPSADRSAALRSMALARLSRGDASGGTELALQSRRMSLEIDDVPGVKWAFLELVNLQMTSDAPPDVLARAREALEYARAHGLVDLETDALFAIAMGDTELSDDERSAACQQTARRYREAGDAHMESGVQRFLGGILRRAHNLDAARQAYEEAVSLAKESGCLGCIWSGQLRLARLCGEIGDLGRAKDLWRELLLGLRRQPSFEAARTLATVAVIVQDLGQLEHAAKLLGAAEALSSIRRPRQLEQRAEPKRAAALRAKLGDEAFDAAFSAGTSMSMDDAVAYSVEVLENA